MMETKEINIEIPSTLSPSSRIWIYQSDRLLNEEEREQVNLRGKAFAKQWAAHKVQLEADFFLLSDLFLVLAVDESAHGASGCSIDSSVQFIREMQSGFQLRLLDRLKVAIWKDGSWEIVQHTAIKTMLAEGKIDAETLTANLLVERLEDLSTRFMLPLKDSWLKKYL